MDKLNVIQPRSCGECDACCVVYAIDEPQMKKAQHVRCDHARGNGCDVYNARPPTCRDFACLWLRGVGGDEDRPDLSGFVMRDMQHPTGDTMVAFTELIAGALEHGTPGAARASEVGYQVNVLVMKRDGSARAIVPTGLLLPPDAKRA